MIKDIILFINFPAYFCNMTDAYFLAQQHIWTEVTDKAKNQAFNCTNGDVFTWEGIGKPSSELFNLEFVPFDEGQVFDLVEMTS